MRIIERDMLLKKIDEWQKKAKNEKDPFNKYTSTFFAYNIFYNLFQKTLDPLADLTKGDSSHAIAVRSLLDEKQLFESLKSDIGKYLLFIPIYCHEYWKKENKIFPKKGTVRVNLIYRIWKY